MLRRVKIKIGDVVEEKEIEEVDYESFMYQLRLDAELHNRDNPDNPMTVDSDPEQKTLSEQVADGEITEDEVVESAKNIIRGQRAIAFVEIDKQAVIAAYQKTDIPESWRKYRLEWLSAPNEINSILEYEQWV